MYKPVIVIPFYNHFNAFSVFAEKLQTLPYPLLVVNDGSMEKETNLVKQLCSKYNFYYIELEKNKGKGGAVIAGMKYAVDNGYTHIVQIDADGQHEYRDIDKFIELSQNNPEHIIAGTPVFDASVPKVRLYGRKITKFWVWIETLGADITDTMCGFRVYPLNKVKHILPVLYFHRMGFDIEILVKSYLNGIKIINLQTKVIYPENGVSHFNCFKDNIEITLMHTTLCCYGLYRLIFKWRKNV